MCVHKFRGFDSKVNHLLALSQHNVLIGLGEDHGAKIADGFPSGSGIPFVKIWDLDQPSPEGGYNIICRHELYQGLHVNKVAVTCLTASEDLSVVALGLHSGSVVVLHGDLRRNRPVKRVLPPAGRGAAPVAMG
eukprot:CAMPEP_0172165012 /NCGR_PEP_ID=MMETSP1050-20130122/8175_1 /TAXON_ID=233186 /ORGANISM="Cryptomonas curvata, Strain CCAP979/52" /LENGTH=133 /DNA_ID=CAMNT_0012835435 /DNA_START=159 /DNA_END=556 /DNA_ORIENTATION=-